MRKFVLSLILCAAMLLSNAVFAQNDGITVKLNGTDLKTPAAAQVVNGRTMLPMRAVFEALGANVTWAGADEIIFATKGNLFITLKIGDFQMVVQRTESEESTVIKLDAAPYIYGGYTFVPVRAVAESLNSDVYWIETTKTVMITNSQKTTQR